MRIERGSTWNIWDFHVHTPYSRLNNNFGFTPASGDDEYFDKYVETLFTKAINKGVVAIGITDYFSIDGYKRIKQEYLSNLQKMKALFPNDDLREKVMCLFIFPNIELRLDTFVGKKSCAVNYHVIFSDKVSIIDIEENFLQKLQIPYTSNVSLSLTKANIKKIGQKYINEGSDSFLIGLKKITVNHEQIKDVLSSSPISPNQYLISIPVDEDLSKISWSSRDSQTRFILYQQCDMLMTSNEKTRNWALAKGQEQKQIEEFGSIKPCIWGSDAHDYKSLFSPADDRFCWIKAEPTFEGLRQVLYEPAERVRIQSTKPDQKNEHQIIDKVIFKSAPDFTSDPIYFSDELTAIIGGKSTGKSLLLSNVAKYLDPIQVQAREQHSTSHTGNLSVDVEVFWKDGKSDRRKIIYIPQSWLNRTVDDDSSDSQLNEMLQSILLQQTEISKAHSRLEVQVSEIANAIKKNILDYVSAHKKIQECEQKLRKTGGSAAYRAIIGQLEEERKKFSVEVGITDAQLKQYIELEKTIAEKEKLLQTIEQEEAKLSDADELFVMIPDFTVLENDGSHRYDFKEMHHSKEQLELIVYQMNAQLSETWLLNITSLKEVLAKKKEVLCNEISPLKDEYQKLKVIVALNDQIKHIESRLAEERSKLNEAISVEDTKKEYIAKADTLQKKILSLKQAIEQAYNNFAETFIDIPIALDTNLKFEAKIVENKKAFCDAIDGLFDKRTLRSIKDKYALNNLDSKISDVLLIDFWNAMMDGTLAFKGNHTLQNALERLFSDWFYVHYIVKSGNDTINNMSPGKKALVLLEMIVNMDSSNCPLLIDQPEDDLDNRSVYNELVQYLRKKKHERQIIVVTHNANVVIGADAEEVIIANQDGEGTKNYSSRFEYRCGAIENISPIRVNDETILDGVLNATGIQQQICDILEGGKEAFDLRRKKYLDINR